MHNELVATSVDSTERHNAKIAANEREQQDVSKFQGFVQPVPLNK